MSVNASCQSVCQETTVSSLLAGRVGKRPKVDDGQQLQEAAIRLLQQHQHVSSLLREVETLKQSSGQSRERWSAASAGFPSVTAGSLLAGELRNQAEQLGVPVTVVSVKMTMERLMKIITAAEGGGRQMLTPPQRLQLCVLLESVGELKSQGLFCAELLWQEYTREQKLPSLELLYHLHVFDLLSVNYVLQSTEGVRQWWVSQLQSLCCWTPPQTEDETRVIQHQVLSTLLGVLVESGFDQRREKTAAEKQVSTQASTVCCCVLDHMLFWILDHVDLENPDPGPELWIQTFERWVGGAASASVSTEAVQRFFTHSLTQTLTYRPGLTVSDAVSQQNQWTFAKSSRLLTSLFHQMSVTFSSQQLLHHLQQVLETHEVNWKHVLSFLSTLLVYNPGAQSSLRELLSTLLTSAFEGYDLEHMITAFLLARQAALEGAAIFSYTDWFKMSFGGSSCHHATRKKSLVFLLKFLSDLVPFEPSHYLKVHVLHPPFTPVKHRSLLMEYISLAKTRLNDLKESLEDMGLYEDVSAAGRASTQPQCPAVQDVERAVSLFETTGRISATVMEASIFRRPYFLTRFLPALLIPRVLPVKADARMSLIEALKKADKIPAAQFSSYVESCQRQRQQDRGTVCLDTSDDPVEVLRVQLQEFRGLVVGGADGEMMAQLSRISHTLGTIFPTGPDDVTELLVITVGLDSPPSPELHVTVINMILTHFCQCLLDACRANPPNKQSPWASRFVNVLVTNRQLVTGLVHRLWNLFNSQISSLSSAHLLGLAALVVHLHSSMSHSPLVQLQPPVLSTAVSVGDALGSALMCRSSSDMTFTVRLCVAAVSYGMCRGNSEQQQNHEQQQDNVLSSLYKKLFYLIPRLMPEVRRSTPASGDAAMDELSEADLPDLWSSVTDSSSSWRSTAWRLWTDSEFQLRQSSRQCQLSLTEWLHHELRVQRSDDALTDPQRQEYQQWACLEFYCPRPEEQGGCGGDMEILCSHLLEAVMDQPLSELLLERLDSRASCLRGTCLPDIMSRLQEFICEFKLTNVQSHRSSRADVCDFLFDFVSRRFSSTGSSALHLQHTLNTWNRVLLSLPPLLLVRVRSEGGRKTVDCSGLIQHINQHQRISCSALGSLSFHLTAHFFRALFCASVCCERPREEVNKSWSQISEQCPLLLTSAVLWWQPLSVMLSSLWSGVGDEGPLSEKLQLITDCQHWANSVVTCSSSQSMPSAPALLLASCLYQSCRGPGQNRQNFSSAVNLLRPERGAQYRQVLVFLFYLCVNRFLSALLYPKQKTKENLLLCSDLLSVLVDSSDWLLVFTPSAEGGVCQTVSLMTSDDLSRMMPWAFYRLLLEQNTELQHRALRCPGFIHTAVLCYIRLLQLFLEGQSLTDPQTDVQQILTQAKTYVLRVISQAPPTALSLAQLRRLEAQCSDLDPEVAAALSLHLDPPDLSPEMDFL